MSLPIRNTVLSRLKTVPAGDIATLVLEHATPYEISPAAWELARNINASVDTPFVLETVGGEIEWFEIAFKTGGFGLLLYIVEGALNFDLTTVGNIGVYAISGQVNNGQLSIGADDTVNSFAALAELIRHPIALDKGRHKAVPAVTGSKRALRDHRPAFTSVDVHLSREVGRARSPLEGVGSKKRFHHVRPFGRTRLGKPELVCGHWRGDSARGVMVPQRYRVVP